MVGLMPGPRISIVTLAAIEAAQAPMRNLPSIAMLAMPDRSEMMPAKAPREIGAARFSVPARTPVMLAVLPARSPARAATTQNGTITSSARRHGNAEPRISCRRPTTPVMTPVAIQMTPTVVVRVMASPPCLTIQNENVAGTDIVLSDSWSANRPSAARMTPRMRAARRALRSALLISVLTSSMAGVAAVMRPTLPSPCRRRRGPASGRTGTASG